MRKQYCKSRKRKTESLLDDNYHVKHSFLPNSKEIDQAIFDFEDLQ
jgi:hypothetical protein